MIRCGVHDLHPLGIWSGYGPDAVGGDTLLRVEREAWSEFSVISGKISVLAARHGTARPDTPPRRF